MYTCKQLCQELYVGLFFYSWVIQGRVLSRFIDL